MTRSLSLIGSFWFGEGYVVRQMRIPVVASSVNFLLQNFRGAWDLVAFEARVWVELVVLGMKKESPTSIESQGYFAARPVPLALVGMGMAFWTLISPDLFSSLPASRVGAVVIDGAGLVEDSGCASSSSGTYIRRQFLQVVLVGSEVDCRIVL